MVRKGLGKQLKVDTLQSFIHVKCTRPVLSDEPILFGWIVQCILVKCCPDTCMFGLWEMEVPLSHEICCSVPQTNNEEVAACNNYCLSKISRAVQAADNTHMVGGKNTIKDITQLLISTPNMSGGISELYSLCSCSPLLHLTFKCQIQTCLAEDAAWRHAISIWHCWMWKADMQLN